MLRWLERVRSLLSYDPETGIFRWIGRSGKRINVGDVAGSRRGKAKYFQIGIDGIVIYNHHLAWFVTHGEWPARNLDHANRDKGDNRIANLRLVTQGQNLLNTGVFAHNTSGVRGVYWDKARKKWIAGLKVKQRAIYLWRFRHYRRSGGGKTDRRSEAFLASSCMCWIAARSLPLC